MSEINCHGEITPRPGRPRTEPATTGLQNRCSTIIELNRWTLIFITTITKFSKYTNMKLLGKQWTITNSMIASEVQYMNAAMEIFTTALPR